eukprot:Nk52_evm36s1444 gene=Nk52_evmTU36s1444
MGISIKDIKPHSHNVCVNHVYVVSKVLEAVYSVPIYTSCGGNGNSSRGDGNGGSSNMGRVFNQKRRLLQYLVADDTAQCVAMVHGDAGAVDALGLEEGKTIRIEGAGVTVKCGNIYLDLSSPWCEVSLDGEQLLAEEIQKIPGLPNISDREYEWNSDPN